MEKNNNEILQHSSRTCIRSVYPSLIRYSRACACYQDFINRELQLTRKLLSQGFLRERLESSLGKFFGRHHDLVDRYEISISQMTMICSDCHEHKSVPGCD